MSSIKRNYFYLMIIGLIFLVGLVLFCSVLGQDYPFWDDRFFLFESDEFLRADLTDFFIGGGGKTRSWPLLYAFQKLIYSIVGENFGFYKAFNLLFHCLNASLLFFLTKKRGLKRALCLSLIFLSATVHVESLSWIMQLGTIASFSFFLLSLLSFKSFLGRHSWCSSSCVLIFYLYSLLIKVTAVLTPFLLVLLAWRKRKKLKSLKYVGSLIAICFLMSFWRGYKTFNGVADNPVESKLKLETNSKSHSELSVREIVEAPKTAPSKNVKKDSFELSAKDFLAFHTLSFYTLLSLNIVPHFIVYPASYIIGDDYLLGRILVAFLILLILALSLKKRFQTLRLPLMGMLLFFLPVSGLFYIPYMKFSFVADHWFYGGSFFLFWTLFEILIKVPIKGISFFMGLFLLFNFYQTSHYLTQFETEEKVLHYNMSEFPSNKILLLHLIDHHYRERQFAKAISVLDKYPNQMDLDVVDAKLFIFKEMQEVEKGARLLNKVIIHLKDKGDEDSVARYLGMYFKYFKDSPYLKHLLNKISN